MTKIRNKLIITTFLILLFTSISTIVNAKYVIDNEFYAVNLDIDRTKPKIEIMSINNTNTGFEGYANKTHIITIQAKIIEKNLKDVFLDKEHIKIKLDNSYIDLENIEISKINNAQNEEIYQIKLKNIDGNGKLKIEFLEGTAIDKGNLENEFVELDTKIIIDNIKPKGNFTETKVSDGKVNGSIELTEAIRNIEGWKFSQDSLKIEMEFTNNISYELPIVDLAGNKSIVEISVTQATYIKVTYASHNSEVGWTFGYGNYDIAGSEAINKDPIFKTEALAFNVAGNIESDFLRVKSYVYTYWGEGSYARCSTSGILYNYGYNPNDGTYKSMKSDDLVTIEGKKYFQLGGSGVNVYTRTDINGNNPIPFDTAYKYPYGICGINIMLKEYSQFSVVYQILVDEAGWITACSDGQECMYSKQNPMSAFRIALIPKTEKQYVLDTWNKDVGTFNLK